MERSVCTVRHCIFYVKVEVCADGPAVAAPPPLILSGFDSCLSTEHYRRIPGETSNKIHPRIVQYYWYVRATPTDRFMYESVTVGHIADTHAMPSLSFFYSSVTHSSCLLVSVYFYSWVLFSIAQFLFLSVRYSTFISDWFNH